MCGLSFKCLEIPYYLFSLLIFFFFTLIPVWPENVSCMTSVLLSLAQKFL